MRSNQKIENPLISLVIPAYNEGLSLRSNLFVIRDFAEKSGVDYEVIVVDDGSTDSTWDVCMNISKEWPKMRGLRLSRNFGKEAAILCGLKDTRSDAVIIMDSDLQHPPELIPKMVKLWLEGGYHIVEAHKKSRGKELFLRRWFAQGFYSLMRFLSGFDLAGAADYKLLSRDVVDAYINMPETNRFFRGLVAWLGFSKTAIPFDIPANAVRSSRWSLRKLIKLSFSAITAFSYIPLQLITVVGFITFLFSFALILQTLYMKFSGHAVEGFTTVILAVLFTGSVTMLSLGIIGAYLARIYEELKRRPNYVVMERVGDESSQKSAGARRTLRSLR
ncbi:MAG: glycosyltransferase family 2 protein [Firmicutes bacterium]|nr:glycosyltransferase family 2 protein [Bacillota bacterium]